MRLEIFRRRLISTNFHNTKLIPAPFCTGCSISFGANALAVPGGVLERTVEICGSNKGDVDAEVAMVGGTIQAKVDSERHRRPCWVLRVAVEAHLFISHLLANNGQNAPMAGRGFRGVRTHFICGFQLELLKDLLRLRLGGTHDERFSSEIGPVDRRIRSGAARGQE